MASRTSIKVRTESRFPCRKMVCLPASIRATWSANAEENKSPRLGLMYENILVRTDDEFAPVVMDFGISEHGAVSEPPGDGRRGHCVRAKIKGGTLAHCSRRQRQVFLQITTAKSAELAEKVRDGNLLSERDDIFSFASTIMELFAGGSSWRKGRPACDVVPKEGAGSLLQEDVKMRCPLPTGLAAVIGDCLDSHGSATMEEVRDQLISVWNEIRGEGQPEMRLIESVGEDDYGPWVCSVDGEVVRGDILIGADGIHSVVRDQIFQPHVPLRSGYCTWRGVIDAADVTDLSVPISSYIVMGPKLSFVFYYVFFFYYFNMVIKSYSKINLILMIYFHSILQFFSYHQIEGYLELCAHSNSQVLCK